MIQNAAAFFSQFVLCMDCSFKDFNLLGFYYNANTLRNTCVTA